MIQPLPKPSKRRKINRESPEYRKAKAEYLAARELWPPGWWKCDSCSVETDTPELDHVERVGMGGAPSRLMDERNWQLLCHDCHQAKDGGMRV